MRVEGSGDCFCKGEARAAFSIQAEDAEIIRLAEYRPAEQEIARVISNQIDDFYIFEFSELHATRIAIT